MADATVHLVTVLYNSADCLPTFLASLAAQDSVRWHLTAIDNASADDGAALLAAPGDARISLVRNRENLGFARAANQGMRAALDAGAEFVVLLNNDVELPSDFLRRFLAARDTLDADVLAPRIMYRDPPGASWYAGGHFERGWVFRNVHEEYDPADTRAVRTVEFASGCCLGLTRAVLARVGMFDERFFVYWEDADLCLRLGAMGERIHYLNDLVLLHEGGHSSGGETGTGFNRLFYRSYVQLLRKHFGFFAALRSIFRLVLRELQKPERSGRQRVVIWTAMLRGLVA
jgi:GT2 family glycosyltransferase